MTRAQELEGGQTAAVASPHVSFIAWTPVEGRSREIAALLGGEAKCFYTFGTSRRWVAPIRYVVDAFRTVRYLSSRRPHSVIATNPPAFPGLIAMGYGRLTAAPILLDSHPAAFGQKESLSGRLLLPLHRWMVSRVAGNVLPSDELADLVRSWGGRAGVFHEAPPEWQIAGHERGARTRVLLVGVLAPDEPVEDALEAARILPDVEFFVTGDTRRLRAKLVQHAPDNVEFLGFLRGEAFRRQLEEADIVLTLSTDDTAAMRAAYEAVYAERPLVVSASEERRRLFPYAIHVQNDPVSIAEGVRQASERLGELYGLAPEALKLQRARLDEQLLTFSPITVGLDSAA
jgi:glycosyltransferase involved in cell wall biosynthesis